MVFDSRYLEFESYFCHSVYDDSGRCQDTRGRRRGKRAQGVAIGHSSGPWVASHAPIIDLNFSYLAHDRELAALLNHFRSFH
jgi:hypothetical protein